MPSASDYMTRKAKEMNIRKLGKNGPAVSAQGLGCIGMSEFHGGMKLVNA
jgi:hypothetical protein